MRIDIFTIFPEYLEAPLRSSLLGRARERGLVDVRVHDPRDQTTDAHHSVDDTPFGGGAGMVMSPEPLFAAVEAADPPRPLLLLSATGRGVDQRVAGRLCDEELSVGGYGLAGGEPAALVVVEAVARLLPGVMGNEES